VVAVLLEVVQGEGGINVLPSEFPDELRKICDANGWLLMLDEVQTGMGAPDLVRFSASRCDAET